MIKDDADAELAVALPALKKAKECVDSLDKNAIIELKSMGSPPAAVESVMACVLYMLNNGKGKTDWETVRNEIRNPTQFIQRVQSFDVQTLSEKTLKNVRDTWFKKPDYNPKEVGTKSKPAGQLCEWTLALEQFQKINKNVIPKKAKAKEMDDKLKEQLGILDKKLEEVRIVKEALANLVANADRMTAEKEALENRMKRD